MFTRWGTLGTDEKKLTGLFWRTSDQLLSWIISRCPEPGSATDRMREHYQFGINSTGMDKLLDRIIWGVRRVTKPPSCTLLYSISGHCWSLGVFRAFAVMCEIIRLLAVSIVMIALLSTFNWADKAKAVVWWKRLKGNETDTLLFGRGFSHIKFHLKRELNMESEMLSSNKFIERWVKVVKITKVDGTTLSMDL